VKIVCVGGANIDRKYVLPGAALPQTSNPARASSSFGGVARNVAENLARLGVDVALLAVVGDDADGDALTEHTASAGVDMSWLRSLAGRRTTEYAAIIDGAGELVIGINDMTLLDNYLAAEIARRSDDLQRAQWLLLDCNLPQDLLAGWMTRARKGAFHLAIDAVSEPKVARLPQDLRGVDVLFLNAGEAHAYLASDKVGDPSASALAIVRRGATAVVLTLGSDGAIVADATGSQRLRAVAVAPIDVTGAGDALVAATLYRLQEGDDIFAAARIGTLAAALTIESSQSVRSDLSAALLEAQRYRLDLQIAGSKIGVST
jgi:pseudouridine kinase